MRLIFLGPPGSGKGTYSSRISGKKGWAHISTGDLFRENVKNQTETGLKAKKHMDEGGLVPDEIVIDMLKERLTKDDCKEGFILDGFPRTTEQAKALEDITKIDVVINLRMPAEVIIEKILARRTCENCGDIYNVADIHFGPEKQYHLPPMNPKEEGKCDKCGGGLVSRTDETKEIIEKRLSVYGEQTAPLINYYSDKSLVRDVDVVGSPDIMVPKIIEVIEKG